MIGTGARVEFAIGYGAMNSMIGTDASVKFAGGRAMNSTMEIYAQGSVDGADRVLRNTTGNDLIV
jgi:hypothetical protein